MLAILRSNLATMRKALATLRSELAKVRSPVPPVRKVYGDDAQGLWQSALMFRGEAAQVNGGLYASEAERERAAQKHAGELQRLRDQAEGNERHLLGRIDEQKAQLQRLVQDRERETAAAAKHAATLETSVSEAAKLNASLRAELTTTQRDLAKRQDAVVAAENALQRAQEQATKDQALRHAELDRARAEIEQLTAALEQHKRDRDEALREAAKLDGKLSALQGQLEEARAEIRRLQKAKSSEPGSA
jgi:chromosome segregation ATPase